MRVAGPRQTDWTIAMSLLGMAALMGLAASVLPGRTAVPATPDTSATRPAPGGEEVTARIAAVDAALARRDVSAAIYTWRDAHGLALGSRRWDAMLAVGDAAMRIDAHASPLGRPTGFRAEARQAYLRALFDARAAQSRTGIDRVADRFAALGDTAMAAQARTLR